MGARRASSSFVVHLAQTRKKGPDSLGVAQLMFLWWMACRKVTVNRPRLLLKEFAIDRIHGECKKGARGAPGVWRLRSESMRLSRKSRKWKPSDVAETFRHGSRLESYFPFLPLTGYLAVGQLAFAVSRFDCPFFPPSVLKRSRRPQCPRAS